MMLDAIDTQIVVEHPADRISVRDVTIEHIARLLARADGVDPDADGRCVSEGFTFATVCTLQGGPPDSFALWHRYAERAEAILRKAFSD